MIPRGFRITATVLLAVGSLLSIRDAGGPPSPMSVASADLQRSEPTQTRYSSKPIHDIQPIADRVLADNPETDGQASSDFGEFVAADWRILRLVVPKPDGELMRVTLARPLKWLETAGRDNHGRLWLEFKELGIANWANVLAIEPCPEAAVGEGRLVTGKFEHSSAEVIDLFVDGVSEPIGTTSNHPFWSEDRRDFVQAGQLRIGEHLRLRDGSTPVVTAAVPRSQSVPVYNLEVDGEHVYYVAASGVLVHNSDGYNEDGTKSIWKAPQPGEGELQLNEGFHPDRFPAETDGIPEAYWDDAGKAFFSPQREGAEGYSGYGEGILEVRIPGEVYDEKFAPLVRPLDGGPWTEIPVPHDLFPDLNDADRILHPPMP